MNRSHFFAVVLALLALLVYWPAQSGSFLTYDDPDYVTENRVVREGLTWGGVKWAFTTGHASNWHPLTWLSHMADCQWFGLDPRAHHFMNVLFHAVNTALLFLLLFRLTAAWGPAMFVAGLFGWHPLHVESVAWISERKDVLSGFFFLLTLLAYTRYVEARGASPVRAQSPNPENRKRMSRRFYAATLLLFAFGLMAKPMLVTLPFVLLLLDYWPLARTKNVELVLSLPKLILEKWPFFLLTLVSCVVTFMAQRAEAVVTLEYHPIGSRLGNAVMAYALYLAKMLWPSNLSIIYPLSSRMDGGRVAVAGIFLGVISWLAWRSRRRRPYFLAGWFWYLGMLVPVIGFVQVGNQSMADRYSYLPLIGVFIAVAYGVQDVATRVRSGNRLAAIAAGLVLAACVFGTERQLPYWRDSISLFTHAIESTRDNDLAHANLGLALLEKGRLDEAMVELGNALEIQPAHVDAHNNLGIVLFRQGRVDEAIAHFETALRFKPDHVRAHYNLANALLRKGEVPGAISHYEATIRLQPEHAEALNNLAWVLATCPDSSLRNGPRAVELARAAARLSERGSPALFSTQAAACAETGQFAEAIKLVQQALVLGRNNPGLSDALREQLQGYEAGRPFRDLTMAPR